MLISGIQEGKPKKTG